MPLTFNIFVGIYIPHLLQRIGCNPRILTFGTSAIHDNESVFIR